MSQTKVEFEKSNEKMELTKVIVLPKNGKTIFDSIKAFIPLHNLESYSDKPGRFVSPRQMIQTRRTLEFNQAKSIALNMHHTLIVK